MNKIIILIGCFGSSDRYMEEETDNYCDRKTEILDEKCCFCGESFNPEDMLNIDEEYICYDCQQSDEIGTEFIDIYDMHKYYQKKGYFN